MNEEITLTDSGDFQSTGKPGIYEGSVAFIKIDPFVCIHFSCYPFVAITTQDVALVFETHG